MFFANFDYIYPPHGIHGWKATDLSVDLAPCDRNLKHPTSRQNFGDAPGQSPKLILTLCLKLFDHYLKIPKINLAGGQTCVIDCGRQKINGKLV